MKAEKVTKAAHTVTLGLTAADLIAALPKRYRTLIETGKAEVFVRLAQVGEPGDELLIADAMPVQVRISYSTEK